jgi:hypothetical protein
VPIFANYVDISGHINSFQKNLCQCFLLNGIAKEKSHYLATLQIKTGEKRMLLAMNDKQRKEEILAYWMDGLKQKRQHYSTPTKMGCWKSVILPSTLSACQL